MPSTLYEVFSKEPLTATPPTYSLTFANLTLTAPSLSTPNYHIGGKVNINDVIIHVCCVAGML